jgi:hypothetical protein
MEDSQIPTHDCERIDPEAEPGDLGECLAEFAFGERLLVTDRNRNGGQARAVASASTSGQSPSTGPAAPWRDRRSPAAPLACPTAARRPTSSERRDDRFGGQRC